MLGLSPGRTGKESTVMYVDKEGDEQNRIQRKPEKLRARQINRERLK